MGFGMGRERVERVLCCVVSGGRGVGWKECRY